MDETKKGLFDPRFMFRDFFLRSSGMPPAIAEELLSNEDFCIACFKHPDEMVRFCAVQCGGLIWHCIANENAQNAALNLLASEKDDKVLRAAIGFSGLAFTGTKRFDVIRLLLEIARQDSFSNSVRNSAYYTAKLVDFGPPKHDPANDNEAVQTEILGQEPKLEDFDCNYIALFCR